MSEQPPATFDREATDGAETAGSTPVTTGATSVIRALEGAGVETCFGVQGGAIMPVYDALYDSSIRHVTMAHEQGAAHAADAYGIVSGDPGVCLATSGPGATNLVTGLADASMDSDPVIALTGQVPTAFVGNDAFQETDTTGLTAPITKTNYFATDSDSVGDTVGEAFAVSGTGRPGPTVVDLPKDVTNGQTERQPGAPRTPSTYDPQTEADEAAVERAARTLERAEKPVILAGGGVIKGDASDALRDFATEYGIPVVTTMPALGAFPEDHELAMEMAGMHGTGYANMAITHCDVMLAVGCRFDDRLTGGVETFAPDAEILHADIDPAEVSKNIEADVALIGDAGTVLEQLDSEMDRTPDIPEWQEQCQTWKAEYPMDYAAPEDRPIRPEFVVEALDEATPEDAIVTTGVGQHQMWACQYWTYRHPRTWVSSHGLGTMGYGLPAAIGAKVAEPDKQVVCFEGDGSFLMTCQELAVAVRENLDITVAVLNNAAVGMVRQWQDAFFEGRHSASQYPWVPAFDKLAEAFGAQGFAVHEYDEVADTVEAALAYDGPSVIDFHIDPGANVYPMVPSGGDNGQFALSEDQL
ncbi:biosynthetic-type acetolactate synthase large subunit [Halalkalicoccus jeotgali]|uniref:Acetolactate synthase n=1 Tax=Halalkalicoccus jeotgali (strain DSM 18796 / CECT 7217 / JCM 14584 / KCTC 4019 / B3) TaxID=795797 RepID=D8J4M6_HALJB|nr:biosynthetic-type acetolactate synthase large subunit [Halalkalicoccus jeotgali]ADJ15493.1 acetolactate synthase, large subunit, biosynthetic type [Halalkalicoccus jeotgali B3]ELY36098.1 acetolactate synthase large subunit [Halalkalicoccus jeotgali B3]